MTLTITFMTLKLELTFFIVAITHRSTYEFKTYYPTWTIRFIFLIHRVK